MKKVILILFLICSISCKEEQKNENKNSENNEVVSKKTPEEKPKSIIDYIDFGDKSNSIEVNDDLGGLIYIDNVTLFKEEESKKVFIVIKLQEALPENVKGNYRIVTRMYPYSIDDLTENSRKNNVEFDSWYLEIMSRQVNNDEYLYGQVANEVDGFMKVKLQLLKKDTKKYSKKQILIEDLETR